MVRIIFILMFSLALLFQANSIFAQEALSDNQSIANDVYVSGSNIEHSASSPRDLFASGFSVIIDGEVSQDAHIAGFDVEVEQAIGEDLYIAGARVSIGGVVGQDLTAAGFKVRLKQEAAVGGNTRMAAENLIIDAPLSGNLVAAGREITLNSTIAGDVQITASEIKFGDHAKIYGTLTYSAPDKIDIPGSVIEESRIEFKELTHSDLFEELIETADQTESFLWISFIGLVTMFLVSVLFFILVSAVFLSFKPILVEKLRNDINDRMGSSLIMGVIGLSTLFGLIPVSIMTLVGIPLIPIIILAGVIFWVLGYLLGTYAVFMRIASSMGIGSDSVGTKLMIVGGGVIALALIKFIPFIGWLANFVVLLLGLGAINKLFIRWLSD